MKIILTFLRPTEKNSGSIPDFHCDEVMTRVEFFCYIKIPKHHPHINII